MRNLLAKVLCRGVTETRWGSVPVPARISQGSSQAAFAIPKGFVPRISLHWHPEHPLFPWGDPSSPSWQSLCWRRLDANIEFGFKNTLLGVRWENFPEYFQPPTLRPPRPPWEPPEMLQGPEATELGIKTGLREEKKSQPGIGEMLCGPWKRDAKMKVSRKRRMKSERGKEALWKQLVLEEHPYENGQTELGDPPRSSIPGDPPPDWDGAADSLPE